MPALSHLASSSRPGPRAGLAGAGFFALLALAVAVLDGAVSFALGGLIETLAGL